MIVGCVEFGKTALFTTETRRKNAMMEGWGIEDGAIVKEILATDGTDFTDGKWSGLMGNEGRLADGGTPIGGF